jgi:hypothetical protein
MLAQTRDTQNTGMQKGVHVRFSQAVARSATNTPTRFLQELRRYMKKTAISSLVTASAVTVGVAIGSFVPAANSALAADKLSIQYDLYTRGIRAFALNYDANIAPNAYKARAKLRPKGLASLVVDLKMDMQSEGRITSRGAVSDSFVMGVKEKGKNGRYAVRFKGLKPASSERKPGVNGDTAAKLEAAASKGVRDTLASILNLSLSPSANPCKGSHRIYNGKEVFELSLKKLKDDTFHNKDGGVYRGPAIACRMVYSTLAGLSPKTEAKYRKNPPVFNAWFAPVQSGSLDRPIHVLVGVTGKIKGKDFVAYANRATLNGRPLNAQSMAKR